MPRKFARQDNQWPEQRSADWQRERDPSNTFERTQGGGWSNMPEGHIPGSDGPSVSQTCPECRNPLNPDGRCSNGYCVTNGGSGQPSHLPDMRTEWIPEQVAPSEREMEFMQDRSSPYGTRWTSNNSVPCPVCGGRERTGKAPCSKCEGKGVIKDWGGSTLDALEHKQAEAQPFQGEPIKAAQPPEVYNPAAYQETIQGYHPAVQQAAQELERSGAKPEEVYQMAQQKQMEVLQRQQQGQTVQNVFQANLGEIPGGIPAGPNTIDGAVALEHQQGLHQGQPHPECWYCNQDQGATEQAHWEQDPGYLQHMHGPGPQAESLYPDKIINMRGRPRPLGSVEKTSIPGLELGLPSVLEHAAEGVPFYLMNKMRGQRNRKKIEQLKGERPYDPEQVRRREEGIQNLNEQGYGQEQGSWPGPEEQHPGPLTDTGVAIDQGRQQQEAEEARRQQEWMEPRREWLDRMGPEAQQGWLDEKPWEYEEANPAWIQERQQTGYRPQAKADDVNKNPLAEIIESDFDGFVPQSVISRIAKLVD